MKKPLIHDSWVAIRAGFDDDDQDTVFRIRTQMPTRKVRSRYPTLVIVKWPYRAKKDGMPRQADLDRMSAFEDALEVVVEQPVLGIQVACLTGCGRRSWRYFVADTGRFLAALKPQFQSQGPDCGEMKEVDDPEGEGLSELMQLLECEHRDG
jgi:hypothetical protein